MRPQHTQYTSSGSSILRVKILYAGLLLVIAIFIMRLFYLQVLRHDYYQKAALRGQLKQYEITPERGTILAHNNGSTTAIVLNQTFYTLYADPLFIKDSKTTAAAVQKVIGGDQNDYQAKMQAKSRYEILAKKLSGEQRDTITKLKLKGIGMQETPYRTYPQGQMAAQLLGFVNDAGNGQYGIEQALNDQLKGKPGELKAITDARGVPLAANKDNIVKAPVHGKQILLTIDLGMQQQLEQIVKAQTEDTKATVGSAAIIDISDGSIKAMANYPTYDPAEFYKVTNQSVFTNAVVSDAYEVGSIMKVLTAAAALDNRSVTKNQTYYDPSHFTVDDAVVKNIEEDGGPGVKSIADVLQLSLNTGATWLLMQMGGGQINQTARETWYNYLTNHYQFGKKTGIEQSYESAGVVPRPDEGYGLNIRYANMAFGQGQTETLLQMGAAMSAVLNGGTYYRPHIVDAYVGDNGNVSKQAPEVVKKDVVRPDVSEDMKEYMEYTIQKNYRFYGQTGVRPEYGFGGKTGTAQIANPNGGYYDDRFSGTFLGFVGGDKPQYVIVVGYQEPHVPGYAGSTAAAPTYFKLANMLIDNFGVQPKK
ncbi:MAG: penicillin-binding protein 2 [Candidatus Saccharimonadales bacterium]